MNTENMLTRENVEPIVKLMEKEFDSHDFIKKFIWNNPAIYGALLIHYNNVRTVHSQISLFLLNNAKELEIENIGEEESDDLFGHLTPCAKWKRLRL